MSAEVMSVMDATRPATGASVRVPGIAPTREDVPDALAPLIRNAWYVIAETKNVTRELQVIKVLGEPLVFYRAEDGEPLVMDNRCAHRRFPLSKGKLEGDVIQCGYHGFKYDRTGACVWAPGVSTKLGFGIRKYPSFEKGPWLWVWMGDEDKADTASIPLPDFESEQVWYTAEAYKMNPSNYMLMIENLLDLTHLHFLHKITAIEQADNPAKSAEGPPNSAGWIKETVGVPLGGLGHLFGADPGRLIRLIESDRQFGPAFNYGETLFHNMEGDNEPLPITRFLVLHALTPADDSTTHQFFRVMFSHPPIHGAEQFIAFLADKVFEEDVEAVGDMQVTIENDRRLGGVESGIPTDRFAATMRRTLRAMRQLEA